MTMTHSDFVTRYKTGSLKVRVDRGLALRMMNSPMMPGRYRAAHLFWTWVWFLSFPAAIALFIWHRWWSGLLVLLVALFPVRTAIGRSACEFVLELALESEEFFLAATEARALVIEGEQGVI